MQFKLYDPAASKAKKRPPQENVAIPDHPAKRPRFSPSALAAMTTTPQTNEPALIDIRARLSPSARMNLALEVLDVGKLSVAKLLMHRLDSAVNRRFENGFLSAGGGLETFLRELTDRYPAAQDCISRVFGHDITLKKVSAEMEVVKAYTLLSSTEVTPHSMRDWTIETPEELALCLSSILRASAVSERSEKENKIKKDTSTVSRTSPVYDVEKNLNRLTTDYQCDHPPARKLSVSKLAAVSSAVWTLAPCSRHSPCSNRYPEQAPPFP